LENRNKPNIRRPAAWLQGEQWTRAGEPIAASGNQVPAGRQALLDNRQLAHKLHITP